MNTQNGRQKKHEWRGINDMQNGVGVEVPDNFSFRAFFHNPNVILGFIASIIGIAVAGFAIFLPPTFQMIGCIAGACISFAGVSAITGYINKCTANEAQNKTKKEKD